MPNGLSNSPSVFQCFINEVFREFLHQFVIVYIDNILIYSRKPGQTSPPRHAGPGVFFYPILFTLTQVIIEFYFYLSKYFYKYSYFYLSTVFLYSTHLCSFEMSNYFKKVIYSILITNRLHPSLYLNYISTSVI